MITPNFEKRSGAKKTVPIQWQNSGWRPRVLINPLHAKRMECVPLVSAFDSDLMEFLPVTTQNRFRPATRAKRLEHNRLASAFNSDLTEFLSANNRNLLHPASPARRSGRAELAPAFEDPGAVRKRRQAGRTPYPSRFPRVLRIRVPARETPVTRLRPILEFASLQLGGFPSSLLRIHHFFEHSNSNL